jgi:hypothetical protein
MSRTDRKRKIIVYTATSADGFIARPDGSVDWLRVPNGDPCPWSPDPQTLEGTEAFSNLRLDTLARTPRIFYPARRNVRPELQVATHS